MHVVMVTDGASPLAVPGEPGYGSTTEQVGGLALALGAAGHEVLVLARRDHPDRPSAESPASGVRIVHLTAGPAEHLPPARLADHLPAFAAALGEHLADTPQAVVHAHSPTAALAARTVPQDLPLVLTLHGAPALGPGRMLAPHVDAVLVTGEGAATELVRAGAPVHLVPYGVDTEVFRPEGPAVRRGERPRLVCVAGLGPGGGVADVLRALRVVPEAELLVAGGGPGLPQLHRQAVEDGVAGRVRFLGPVPRQLLPDLLRSADAVVHAPHEPVGGVAALEAMACGRAVVATEVDQLRDVVVDGVTGLLVPPARPRELAAALRAVVGGDSTADAFGIAGRDRVLARFDRALTARAVAETYAAVRRDPRDRGPAATA